MMLPKVCAEPSSSVEVSADKALSLTEKLVTYSKEFLGCPYKSGSTGPATFDCSGYVYSMFRESIGVQLPRKSSAMYARAKKIEDSEIRAGDLLFFTTTSSGTISHVGIYLEDGNFIHSASDGPETGVIISTIKSGYWKTHYNSAGRIINISEESKKSEKEAAVESVKKTAEADKATEDVVADATTGESKNSEAEIESKKNDHPFLSKLVLDGTLALDWNFFDADSFKLCFRGFDTMAHAMYDGDMKPGLGTYIRYDRGTGVVQLPIVLTYSLSEYIRLFIGPVITIGKPTLPGDSDQDIKASFFPGILGVCFNTPSIEAGKFKISFTQDIHYTVYNTTDKAALSPYKSLASGLVLSSGIRVTLPMSNVL
ncbi:MAG: C40 family peptidase [Treponema sp.]|nr:C40 family peptidase [Treponema sp.]